MVAPIAFVTVPVYEKRGVNFHQPVLDYDDDNGVRLGGVTLVGEMYDADGVFWGTAIVTPHGKHSVDITWRDEA